MAIRGIDGSVAGRADIVVVPNIEYGNALYKAMVYFMSATAAALVAGARAPIVPTSRADPPEARRGGGGAGGNRRGARGRMVRCRHGGG